MPKHLKNTPPLTKAKVFCEGNSDEKAAEGEKEAKSLKRSVGGKADLGEVVRKPGKENAHGEAYGPRNHH